MEGGPAFVGVGGCELRVFGEEAADGLGVASRGGVSELLNGVRRHDASRLRDAELVALHVLHVRPDVALDRRHLLDLRRAQGDESLHLRLSVGGLDVQSAAGS